MASEFETFEQFWPYYVREHASPLTRRMHLAGTTVSMLALARAIRTRNPAWIPVALVAGYGPAWVSHFFVEHNKPATFKHPLWSLLADFKMAAMMLAGEMDHEIERLKTRVEATPATPDVPATDPLVN